MKTLLTCLLFFALNTLGAQNIREDSTAVQSPSIDTATCDPNIRVQKSFCPNCDGINDIFSPIVSGEQPESIEMIIYDRWGVLIYQQKSASPVWDGTTAKGTPCAAGVYMWILKITYAKNEKETCKGYVGLVR